MSDEYLIEAQEFDASFNDVFEQARSDDALDFASQFDETRPQSVGGDIVGDDAKSDVVEFAVDTTLGAGRDIGLGVLNAPRSMGRGLVNAANNFVEVAQDVHDFNTRVFTGNEAQIDLAKAPNFEKPKKDTVTGSAIETITEFAVGFKGVDKAFKASKYLSSIETAAKGGRAGNIAVNAVKGALADMAVFDAQDARLSNLVEQVPGLQNPVTEYLAANEDDGAVEAKFKQGIEGLALGGLGDVLFDGLRILKKGKGAKAQIEGDGLFDVPPEEAVGIGVEGKNFDFLGDANTDDLFLRKSRKLDDAEAEVQGAFGKTKQIKDGKNPEINDFQINFARIEGPDDIKQLMDEMVNRPELKESIDASRRGVRDERTTLTAATDIDGFDSLMARRTGDAPNAEMAVAMRKTYYDTTEKLMDAAKRAASPEASSIDQFNFRKMVALHHAVQKEFMGARAEAGRALQAWSIPVGGSGAENARNLDQVLNEFGGEGASKELAKRLASVGNNLNTSQINEITTKAVSVRTADAMSEIWTLGLLTNPTTHVVNLQSNVLTGLTLGLERFGMVMSKDSNVSMQEGVAYFHGMMEAQKAAIKNAAQAFKTGETGIFVGKLDLPRIRSSSRDILDPEGRAGVFSKAIDVYGLALQKYAGGALAAGDEYSKTVLYQAQVRALATREGIAQGLNGADLKEHVARALNDTPSNIRADAMDFANYGTFTKELGSLGQSVQRAVSDYPMLRFVVPFIRTPANIFKFTFERTPLGVLSSKVRDDISAGGLRKSRALTRIGMGTSMMFMGNDLAMNGQITGAGPSDSKQRAALRRTGWQPYSIKVGDTYYSYARFDPLSTILGMSADLAEILSNYEAYDLDAQKQADELVTAAAIAVGNQVVGKTFLKGFADLTEVLSDPARYAEGYINRFAGSFVPAGAAGIERAVNPEISQVFNMMDAVKSRIPGLSEDVPPRRNIWGDPLQSFYPEEGSIASASAEGLLSMFNPVYYSVEKDAPVDKWMLRNGFSINMPQKRQSFDGTPIDLRDYPHAYDRLVEARGNDVRLQKYGNQTMKEFFEGLISEEDPFGRHVSFFLDFGNDFADQQNFISQVVRDYNDAAKDLVLDEFPEVVGAIGRERINAEKLKMVRPSLRQEEGGQ